ncbi:MAG: diaminopimelate epimerase [Thermosediminibacterales bacterium]|nr:diaminopimelate epimerase [Thermosediminibacterales bacterium]MDK2836351.1 diaminopimelate epimerase [Thermosediminibacterales bacterium]
MHIKFTKMQGCGNDFIVIDNRDGILKEEELPYFSAKVCIRKQSMGADGVLLLENSSEADFKMRLFNPDGSEGEMCGNGARCIARYAYINGVAQQNMIFETHAGNIEAAVHGKEVGIKLPDVDAQYIRNGKLKLLDRDYRFYSLYLGVPHCVIFLEDDLTAETLTELGRKIRYNTQLFPEGTNVNFVKLIDNQTISVTTYERGVEQITMSCGTGSTASAIVSALNSFVSSPVTVVTLGGRLRVTFKRSKNRFYSIELLGKTALIASGFLYPEAYR